MSIETTVEKSEIHLGIPTNVGPRYLVRAYRALRKRGSFTARNGMPIRAPYDPGDVGGALHRLGLLEQVIIPNRPRYYPIEGCARVLVEEARHTPKAGIRFPTGWVWSWVLAREVRETVRPSTADVPLCQIAAVLRQRASTVFS